MTPFGVTSASLLGSGAGPLGTRHCDLVAAHGFEALELSVAAGQFELSDAPHTKAIVGAARAAGLTITALSAPLAVLADAAPRAVDLGVPLVVGRLDGCRARPLTGHEAIPSVGALRRVLEDWLDRASHPEIRLALDVPAGGSFGAAAVVDLLESLESPGGTPIGVCFDAGHAHLSAGQGGAADAAEILSGFVMTTHLHDSNGREDAHRAPGAGTVDWPATIMALWKAGFTGPWMFDLAAGTEPDAAEAALRAAVGARRRLQAILEDLAQPFAFTE